MASQSRQQRSRRVLWLVPVALLLAISLWMQQAVIVHDGQLWLSKSQPTLFPPDRDGDLVRDDVGRAIRQTHSGVTAAALMQVARSWQKMASVHAGSTELRYAAGNRAARALSCAFSPGVLGRAGMSAEDMYRHVEAIRQQLLDTPSRRAAFAQSEAGREGRPWQIPASPCDFDPAAMAG